MEEQNEIKDLSEAINVAIEARSIDGWLADIEAIALYLMAKNGPKKGEIVEIGTFKGKSTFCLARGAKAGGREKVTTIDTHQGSPEHQKGQPFAQHLPEGGTEAVFKENMRKAGIDDYINSYTATSEEIAKNWKLPIRLLFIDGAHEYESVKLDYSLWQPFIVKGGTISFHDTTGGFPGPLAVVNQYIRNSDKFKDVVTIGSMTIATKVK